ncbi:MULTISPECIES: CPBP family intramembrane glutamic endopeptidase [unclassified Companilactobacillus]|uniref:CPBP family intramembrane glutamic endopeptidase n=1 Tax=unclassified Companilactobacillus TaxID=2767904 RepID=UPI002FF294DB
MNKSKNNYQPIKTISHIIAFLLLFILEQLPLSVLTLTKKQLGSNYESYTKIAPVVTIILLFVAATIIIFVFKKIQIFPTQKFTKKTWLVIAVALILVTLVNYATLPFMKPTNSNVEALELIGQNNMAILIFFSLIVAPILEEIIFRGLFMNWFFVDRPLVAIIVSGLIFGYIHAPFGPGTDWFYALSKILLGVVLAGVYYRTKNIKANITVHFLNNFLGVILQ